MSDPRIYHVAELDAIVDDVRSALRQKLATEPDLFGQDKGVPARIAATLAENAPKGTLAVAARVDANSSPGIMATVDLTILDRNAKETEVEQVARRAAKEHCATVCVYPEHLAIVSRVMRQEGVADVSPIAVVGFPEVPGPAPEATASTVRQTREAIAAGAKEIDMVLPLSFREDKGDDQEHFRYIKAVVDEAHASGVPVKVILETAYLTDRQIARASLMAKIAGADWIKTSTGFAQEAKLAAGKNLSQHKGATPHDVALIRRAVGDFSLHDDGNPKLMGVKASGGVRNRAQAQALLHAGADRLGASGGIDVRTESEIAANAGRLDDLPVDPRIANAEGFAFHQARMNYAWDWFQYHADQRLKAFNFFLVIVGVLVVGYATAMKESLTAVDAAKAASASAYAHFALGIALCGVVISIAFLVIEVRNTELVACGRRWLDRLEGTLGMTLRRDDENRLCLNDAFGPVTRVLTPCKNFISHKFWIRLVYALALVGFSIATAYAACGF